MEVTVSVYIYESGFEEVSTCIYAQSKRGNKIYGEQLWNSRKKRKSSRREKKKKSMT